MSEFAAQFHFLRPWWLLALLALPVLWRALAGVSADAGGWRGAIDAHLLKHLLVREADAPQSGWPRALACVAWVVACLALAGPAWERLPQPLYQNRSARVFALELSASMFAQDAKPSRYERARFKLADALARSGDMQTALIAYAGDAFVVAPLTDDVNTVLNLVDALDPSVMPAPGNDTARAIDAAVALIRQAGVPRGELVLLADSASDDALPAARRARAAGVRVSVLGIGSAAGAPVPLPQGGFLKNAAGDIAVPKLDAPTLSALADAGGGRYVQYRPDAADLDALLATSPTAVSALASDAAATTTRYLDRGPWLVLLLLPLAAMGFRRGWLMVLPWGALLLHTSPAQAFSWADLWQRADQQARAALDAGHAQQAQQLARTPDLRGAAAYRVGDFAAAERDFVESGDADAQYNRGNALARQGRFSEAIAAYDAALKLSPHMDDAVANKKAVEEWLKQQQQQQQQQSKQQGGKDHQGHQQSKDGAGSSSGQSDEQGNPQQGKGSPEQQSSPSDANAKQGDNPQQRPGDESAKDNVEQSSSGQSEQETAEQESANAQSEQQAGRQFRQRMDEAVKNEGKDADKKAPPSMRLGANDNSAPKDERQQAVEQLIERVPDDPGGLLRRKFQLEYQRRQKRGGGPQ